MGLGSPCKTEPLSSAVAKKVIPTLSMTKAVRIPAPIREFEEKKSEISTIKAGNRPLQGTRALVRIASSRSRGEVMMRQPITPAALHPNPMAMVRACLPQPPQRSKR